MGQETDNWEGEEHHRYIKEKIKELLCMPEVTPQPAPKLLSTVQRDGYRVEKWELYPDDFTAVPFLALIPDSASEKNRMPGILCLPGSNHSKEFVAGEELLDHPNCQVVSWPERNQMGKIMAQNGMAAFVFDNPATGECSVLGDPAFGETQFDSRVHMTAGYLRVGLNYVGMSVFQKLRALEFIRSLPYIDVDKLAISAHSLGTEPAMMLGLLCDDIKAIIHTDALNNRLIRFAAITEEPENKMVQDIGNWHIIPGMLSYFDYADLCAAYAPNYLALTEGGGEEPVGRVVNAYKMMGAENNLIVTYYPEYSDIAKRESHGLMPDHGISVPEYYHYNNIAPEDHSFRREPSLELLRRCFGK